MPKVLVVDDSQSVREVVEHTLVAEAMDVVSAASGTEAMEQFEREHPDLVVCDVVMPDRNGYEICRFVKAHPRFGQTPVLLMSGIVNSRVLAEAARVRSDDVLLKPFEADELIRRVSLLLASGGGAGPGCLFVDDTVPASGALEPVGFVTPDATAVKRLEEALGLLGALPGVEWVALTDGEGFLVGSVGEAGLPGEVAAALASGLCGSMGDAGRALGRGAAGGMLVEFERDTLLVQRAGPLVLTALLGPAATVDGIGRDISSALPNLVRIVCGEVSAA
jgi:CheY-like chemotaxis protein/predicted regulator of Ras-like GTPase activity (Roadblock/LC7/MglB family)